jgi:hypothetical protein
MNLNLDISSVILRINNFVNKLYGPEKIELKNNNILLISPINIYIQCLKNNLLNSSSIKPDNTIVTDYYIIISNNINDTEYTYEPLYYSNIEKRELINFDFIRKVTDCCNNFYKVKKLLQTHGLTKSIYFKFNPTSICLKILLSNNTGSLIYNLIHVENYNNHEAYYSNSYEHQIYDLFDNYNWYKVNVNKFNEYEIYKVLIN